MNELLARILASTLFLLQSLVFWIWIALGIFLGWGLALVISRMRMRSGSSPMDAAYTGAVVGFWLSALIIMLLTWFFWRSDYVLVAFVLILVVMVPWLVVSLIKRNEPSVEV